MADRSEGASRLDCSKEKPPGRSPILGDHTSYLVKYGYQTLSDFVKITSIF
jgi:hypothetical protein